MNQEEWTRQLRDKLADHKTAAPDDLWADIEAALPEAPVAELKKKNNRAFVYRWAVAASLAVLLSGGALWLWNKGQTDVQATETASTETQQHDENQQILAKAGHGTMTNEHIPIKDDRLATEERQTTAEEPATEKHEPATEERKSAVEETTPLEQKPDLEERRTTEKGHAETDIVRQLDSQIASLDTKSHDSPLSIGLYASNGFGDQSHANGVLMSANMLAAYDYTPYLPVKQAAGSRAVTRDPVYLVGYEERQNHRQPISFGLSVSYQLLPRLAIQTGIVYTRLKSEFVNVLNYTPIEKEQTLYYIGVPLSVQYRLWRYGGLNVYATGGGQADWNVKARYVSAGVEIPMEKDRWQLSVQGALGIAYNVIPQIGIYAEPGVKYYFNNGSKVNNFFKDKPLNFNLQVGLRVNF